MKLRMPDRSYLIAFAAGVPLAWYQFKVMGAVAALPWIPDLMREIKAAHLPVGWSYSILVGWLPIVALAFVVGAALRRFVRGVGVSHLLVCGAPSVMYLAVLLVYIYAGTDVSWFGELPGVARIPLALLLAMFVRPGRAQGPDGRAIAPVRQSTEGGVGTRS